MKKLILLADDDESIRKTVARVLESEGHEVVTAASGREAIGKFLGNSPDLMLLDLNMPDKDGWEALEVITQFAPFLPVVVISARSNQYKRAVQAGVDALMEKPLDLHVLLRTISELLAQSEAQRMARLNDRNFTTAYLTPASTTA